MRRALIALSVIVMIGSGWIAWRPLMIWTDEVTQLLVPSQTIQSAIDRDTKPALISAVHPVKPAESTPSRVIATPSATRVTTPTAPIDAKRIEYPAASVTLPPATFHYQLVTPDRRYAFSSETELTVLGLMDQLVGQGFAYTSEQYDFGVFVTSIDGLQNNSDSRQYWTYTVDNQPAVIGVDQYRLEDNDTVSWSYSAT